jgi:hypothetical protein
VHADGSRREVCLEQSRVVADLDGVVPVDWSGSPSRLANVAIQIKSRHMGVAIFIRAIQVAGEY